MKFFYRFSNMFIIILSVICVSCNRKLFVTIGTGAVTGVYYPTGGAICRMINKKSDVYGIKMTVESTAGSVYNINAVLSGDLDLGIAQSDRQYQAYYGLNEWSEMGPQKDIRSVFAIHPEAVTLVASVKSGIRNISDLKGKRVNLGNPGSGQLQNARDILKTFGLDEDDIRAEYVKAIEAPSLLQDERIDAFFYTVGHPSGNIKEATSGRIKVRLVPIKEKNLEQLIQECPYYTQTQIPHRFYPKAVNETDIPTIGVKSTLVASKFTDQNVVYAITKEIFENIETFQSLHPAYFGLTRQNMLEGLTAPLHQGACRYFKEIELHHIVDPHLIITEHSNTF